MNGPGAKAAVPDGWVDLQVNGYVGIDFSSRDLTVAAIRRVTEELVRRGTAAYCPTFVTSEPGLYERNLPILAAAMDEPDLQPHLLGLHLEGPFLADAAKGAHKAAWLRRPDPALFKRWMELAQGRIRILTLAPELDGAEDVIRMAAGSGVTVWLGHHMADAASLGRAVNAGAKACTHLGNGIPNLLTRHPNPIWTQLAEDRLVGCFITDGHHLPAEFVRVAWRAKGVERFVVTSDAAYIAGLPPGRYKLMGGDVVSEPGGRVALADGSALAGSSATMADCLAWLRSRLGLSEEELRTVGRCNPLRLIGLAP